jgi:ceramide synthetase
LFYVIAFWAGLYILWDKPWTWDTKHCWYDYPFHPLTSDLYWYYMVEMSFYWSLAFSICIDVKRKDFVEQLVHHVVTLSLMVVSWTGNMTRVGTLIMCIHDAVDYILELAKMTNYIKWQRATDALFVVFAVVFFLTRIVIYPYRVLYSSLFEGHVIIGFANIYYAYNGLLIALQVLHIIWFYMILRMVYGYLISGTAEKDDRSESETATNSEDDNVSYKPADGLPITGNLATNSAKNAAANGAAAVTTTNGKKKNKIS